MSQILASDPVRDQGSGEPIVLNGVRLRNTRFDYPVTINTRVLQWVDYFLGRGREHFAKYLERSERFIPYIRPILRSHGMPEDLVYLAMIESGFNNHARSRAKAVGPWQFISATGKRYGLKVNWWVDERRDTRRSTLAAIDYLKDLYNLFQSWELAAAAYNAGESKIARAVQRYGTRDFWSLSRHRFLRPETRNYVPKIIAAALLAKNREQFGFPPSNPALAGDGAAGADELADPADKLDDVLDDEVADASPEGTPEETSDESGDVATTSEGDGEDDAAEEEGGEQASGKETNLPLWKPEPAKAVVSPPHVDKSGVLQNTALLEFEVRSPADLARIAEAAGVTYQSVKSLNPELLRWCTPPHSPFYRVKLPATAKDRFLETYNKAEYPKRVDFLTYKAKRGDTPSRIARHFGIRVDPIADLNGISAKRPLRSGMPVLLPLPNDRSRSLASLDVRDPPEKKRKFKSKKKSRIKPYRVSMKKRNSARTLASRNL